MSSFPIVPAIMEKTANGVSIITQFIITPKIWSNSTNKHMKVVSLASTFLRARTFDRATPIAIAKTTMAAKFASVNATKMLIKKQRRRRSWC